MSEFKYTEVYIIKKVSQTSGEGSTKIIFKNDINIPSKMSPLVSQNQESPKARLRKWVFCYISRCNSPKDCALFKKCLQILMTRPV